MTRDIGRELDSIHADMTRMIIRCQKAEERCQVMEAFMASIVKDLQILPLPAYSFPAGL